MQPINELAHSDHPRAILSPLIRPLQVKLVVPTSFRARAPPPQATRTGGNARQDRRLHRPVCRGVVLLHADADPNRDAVTDADAYPPQGGAWRFRPASCSSLFVSFLALVCYSYGCEWREERREEPAACV